MTKINRTTRPRQITATASIKRGYGMLLKMFIGLQIFDLKEYKRSCRKVANQKEVKVKTVFQIALTFLLLSVPARAQEFEYGTSTVCDTQQQMERYVALLGGNIKPSISSFIF